MRDEREEGKEGEEEEEEVDEMVGRREGGGRGVDYGLKQKEFDTDEDCTMRVAQYTLHKPVEYCTMVNARWKDRRPNA